MNNGVKYWLYYLIDDETQELYAYTDIREYHKIFELDRNMKVFKKVKKILNREEINFLAKRYKGKYLTKTDLDVYDKKRLEWITIPFVLTEIEMLNVGNLAISLDNMHGIIDKVTIDPRIFKKEILRALDILCYVNLYNEYVNDIGMYNKMNCKISADVFGVFIRLYGRLMKGSENI